MDCSTQADSFSVSVWMVIWKKDKFWLKRILSLIFSLVLPTTYSMHICWNVWCIHVTKYQMGKTPSLVLCLPHLAVTWPQDTHLNFCGMRQLLQEVLPHPPGVSLPSFLPPSSHAPHPSLAPKIPFSFPFKLLPSRQHESKKTEHNSTKGNMTSGCIPTLKFP